MINFDLDYNLRLILTIFTSAIMTASLTLGPGKSLIHFSILLYSYIRVKVWYFSAIDVI